MPTNDRIRTLETMLQCHTDGRLVLLARIKALEAMLLAQRQHIAAMEQDREASFKTVKLVEN